MAGVRGFLKGSYVCHLNHQHTNMTEVEQCNDIRRRQIEKERQTELAKIKKEKKVELENHRTRQLEAHATTRKAECYQHAVQNIGFNRGGYPGNYLQIEGPPGNFPSMYGGNKAFTPTARNPFELTFQGEEPSSDEDDNPFAL